MVMPLGSPKNAKASFAMCFHPILAPPVTLAPLVAWEKGDRVSARPS
jgi:hypothetical protein